MLHSYINLQMSASSASEESTCFGNGVKASKRQFAAKYDGRMGRLHSYLRKQFSEQEMIDGLKAETGPDYIIVGGCPIDGKPRREPQFAEDLRKVETAFGLRH